MVDSVLFKQFGGFEVLSCGSGTEPMKSTAAIVLNLMLLGEILPGMNEP